MKRLGYKETNLALVTAKSYNHPNRKYTHDSVPFLSFNMDLAYTGGNDPYSNIYVSGVNFMSWFSIKPNFYYRPTAEDLAELELGPTIAEEDEEKAFTYFIPKMVELIDPTSAYVYPLFNALYNNSKEQLLIRRDYQNNILSWKEGDINGMTNAANTIVDFRNQLQATIEFKHNEYIYAGGHIV